MKVAFCEACHAMASGIKSRIAYAHTCGRTISEPVELRRNDRTTIDKLDYGARFYKLADNKLTIWTKVQYGIAGKHYGKLDGAQWPVEMKADTLIVFLRHAGNE